MTIEITSGKAIVLDPCYKARQGVVIDNMLNGTYRVYVSYDRDDRIAALTIAHTGCWLSYYNESNAKTRSCRHLESDEIYVDSGQVGIFDAEYFIAHDAEERDYDNPNCLYGRACKITETEDHYGLIDTKGVVSESGYGDGDYECYTRHKGDKVVAISVIFVEEDEDEYPEEYYGYRGF